jgi:hypothetical protein
MNINKKIIFTFLTILSCIFVFNGDVNAQSTVLSNKFVDVPSTNTIDLELTKIAPMPPRTPGEFGEKQFWLLKDSLAPFDGVLLNPEAMAFILSEYKASYERALAALITQKEMDLSKLNLEMGKLHLEVSAITTKSDIVINGRDEEIKRLQKINKDQMADKSGFKRKLFIGLGTAAAGLIIGFIAGGLILN